MALKDIVPWWGGRREVAPPSGFGEVADPLTAFHRDLNQAFSNFFRTFEAGSGLLPFGTGPRIEVAETNAAIEVKVELPGLDQKDVEVSIADGLLTVKGERKLEREDKRAGYTYSERSYGAFHRAIPLPPTIDADHAEASFRNGVLTVTVPKTGETESGGKRIDVKKG